jgi:hypothetical protein
MDHNQDNLEASKEEDIIKKEVDTVVDITHIEEEEEVVDINEADTTTTTDMVIKVAIRISTNSSIKNSKIKTRRSKNHSITTTITGVVEMGDIKTGIRRNGHLMVRSVKVESRKPRKRKRPVLRMRIKPQKFILV